MTAKTLDAKTLDAKTLDAKSFIAETFAPLSGRRLLDIGCGDGRLVGALMKLGAVVTGIDPNAQAIAAARAAVPEAGFQTASAQALPFEDGAFDGAILLNALHHVENPDAGLREAARVVRPGAPIVVIEPLAEGSFFEALRPVEDETEVRALAQQAIARSGLTCRRETVFERREDFSDVDDFLRRVVAVDPARAEAARATRKTVAAILARVAPPDGTRRFTLVQPLRAHVLSSGDGPI